MMSNDEQKFSLNSQIKKRKTQEMLRTIEDQRVARLNGVPTMKALVGDKQQTAPDPRRTTVTSRVPTSASMKTQQAARVSQTMPAFYPAPKHSLRERLALVIAAAALLVLIVSTGALVVMLRTPTPTQSPAKIVLPVLSAADIVNQLKLSGVPVVNSREFAAPIANWKANQEFQIDVSSAGSNGTFILLSYPSQSYTIPDIIRARNSATFKQWQLTTGSNLILLTSPDSNPALGKQVQQQILQFLVDQAHTS